MECVQNKMFVVTQSRWCEFVSFN